MPHPHSILLSYYLTGFSLAFPDLRCFSATYAD